jgi:hypothetical protein
MQWGAVMDDEAKLSETPEEFLDALGERLVAKEGVDKDLAASWQHTS